MKTKSMGYFLLGIVLLVCSTVNALDGWSPAGVNLGSTTNIVPSTVYPGVLYAGSLAGFYYSDNEGLTWQKRADGDFQYITVSKTVPEVILAGYFDIHIRISEDQGQSWVVVSIPQPHAEPKDTIAGEFYPGSSDEAFLINRNLYRVYKNDHQWMPPEEIIPDGGWGSSYPLLGLTFLPDYPDTVFLLDMVFGLVAIQRQGDNWIKIIDNERPWGFWRLTFLTGNNGTNRLYFGGHDGRIAHCQPDLLDWVIIYPPDEQVDCPVNRITFSTARDSMVVSFGRSVYEYYDNAWLNLEAPEFIADDLYSMIQSPYSANLLTGGATGCIVFDQTLRTWHARNKGLIGVDLLCFEKMGETLYLGSNGAGIFRSLDQGETWIQSNSGLPGMTVTSFSAHPGSVDRLYATCSGMLAVSDNRGRTWRQIGLLNSELITSASVVKGLNILDQDLIYVGKQGFFTGDSPVCVSSDMGETLVDCYFNQPSVPPVTFIHKDFGKSSRVFVGCDGLWESNNTGIEFLKMNHGAFSNASAMAQEPELFDLMWVARKSHGIMKSDDSGVSWRAVYQPETNIPWNSIIRTLHSSSDIYICSNDRASPGQGLMMSRDEGESWNSVFSDQSTYSFVAWSLDTIENNGLPEFADRIWVIKQDGSIAANTLGGPLGWEGIDATYSMPEYQINDIIESDTNPDIIYMATENHGVLKSVDAGWTWDEVNIGLPETHRSVRTIDIDPRFPDIVAHRLLIGCANEDDTDHRVYESIDSAESWQRKDVSGGFNAKIVDLNIIELPVDNEDVWLVTYGDGAWRSSDNGEQWLKQTFETDPPGQFLTSVTHTNYTQGGGEPWITASSHGGGGSFIWDPGQNQFRVRNHGLPGYANNNVHVDFIAADPERYGVFWAATDQGLYLTKDFCESWAQAVSVDNSTTSRTHVWNSSISFNNGDVYYARRGTGVYRSQDGLSPASWTELSNGLNQTEKDSLSIVHALGRPHRRRLLGCPAGTPPLAYPLSQNVKPTGADLKLSLPLYQTGDLFELDIILSNSSQQLLDVGVCILLELYGQFYWWPSWGTDFDFVIMTLPPGQTPIDVLEFTWPEGAGSGAGTLYGAMLSTFDGSLVGDLDWGSVGWKE